MAVGLGKSTRFWRGILCALLGGVLWGFSGACSQFLLANYDITPSFIVCARMLGAGALFAVVLLARQRAQVAAMLRDAPTVRRLLVFGAGGLFLCQITYVVLVSYTNAGTATVLQSANMVFVMLFACLLARRLPQVREVAGLALAIAATWLIATQGCPGVLALPVAGLAWGLANALSCTFYIMYPKRLFAQWGSFAVTGAGMLVGGAAALVVWLAGGLWGQPAALPQLDAPGVVALVAIAVLGTFAAFALYLHGVSVVGSVRGSLLGAVEPLSATLFAALWLGTAFTGADWAGFILMTAMIFLVSSYR